MKQTASIAVVIAVSISCAYRDTGPSQGPADSHVERYVLEDALAEMREILYAIYDDLSVEELTEKAEEAAAKAFKPRMSQLTAMGSRKYLALPLAHIKTAEYIPVDPDRSEMSFAEFEALTSWGGARGRLLSVSWNPVTLASVCRTGLFARVQVAGEMAKMYTLNSIAPPRTLRLGSDPANPTILFEEPGGRLTVVSMTLQDDRFVLERAQRLEKRR